MPALTSLSPDAAMTHGAQSNVPGVQAMPTLPGCSAISGKGSGWAVKHGIGPMATSSCQGQLMAWHACRRHYVAVFECFGLHMSALDVIRWASKSG